MTFWSTATNEQRLVQIDAGIELGMTSKQVAMCLGAPVYVNRANAVLAFANTHGRSFPRVPVRRPDIRHSHVDKSRKGGGFRFRETRNREFEIFTPTAEEPLFDEVAGYE